VDDHKTYFADKLIKAGFTDVQADSFLLGFNIRALARKRDPYARCWILDAGYWKKDRS